jgi:hypothetical protein
VCAGGGDESGDGVGHDGMTGTAEIDTCHCETVMRNTVEVDAALMRTGWGCMEMERTDNSTDC